MFTYENFPLPLLHWYNTNFFQVYIETEKNKKHLKRFNGFYNNKQDELSFRE